MTHDHTTIATGEDMVTGNTNPGPSSPQKCQWHGSGKPELPLASFSVLQLLLRQIRNHKPKLPLTEGCGLEETELAEVCIENLSHSGCACHMPPPPCPNLHLRFPPFLSGLILCPLAPDVSLSLRHLDTVQPFPCLS